MQLPLEPQNVLFTLQIWIFSGFFDTKLNIFVLWTKQDIWGRHLGLCETLIVSVRVSLTCHPDGVVAEQRVAVGEPARVDARVLVRHVDDAQHPLAEPRPVARHQPGTVFEPDDRLRVVLQVTWHFQGVPHAQNIVLQEGCLAGHRVCRGEDKEERFNTTLITTFNT